MEDDRLTDRGRGEGEETGGEKRKRIGGKTREGERRRGEKRGRGERGQ